MDKSGPSAAGTEQLRRSLVSGAVPPARESMNRATATHGNGARNVIKNRQARSRSMDRRKSSKQLKLNSSTMGQPWSNVAGGIGARFGRGPKPLNSTADKRRAGRHERSRRGAAPVIYPSWPKKGKQPAVYMSGGFGKRQVSTQKRSLQVQQQHPLAEAFTDSLDQTTAYLSTGLHQTLSDKLEILLSQVSATTALSQTYLTSASDLKEGLSTSSYLLSGAFGEELGRFRCLVGEKQVKVLALWKQWKECVDEIRQLGIGEAALAEAGKGEMGGGNRGVSAVNRPGAHTEGDSGFEKLIERISVVGNTWVKKMGECEEKIADEELKQREFTESALS